MTKYNRDVDNLNREGIKGAIFLNPALGGDDTLAHELGHHLNKTSKNPIKRVISRISPKIRREMKVEDIPKEKSIIEGLKSMVKSKIINVEEHNASKNGMSLLKKVGATPEELSIAKLGYDRAYNTYKYGQCGRYLKLLAKGIKPNK